MKKNLIRFLLVSVFICLTFYLYAQAPPQYNFQGVARNSNGKVIIAKPIALRFTIRTGGADGFISYREQRSALTDSNGVFNTVIGGAGATNKTGSFDTAFFLPGSKFLQVEMDTAKGSSFVDLGATQVLSVPYALHSTYSLESLYAASSGKYFFEAVFQKKESFPGSGTIIFPRTNYNHFDPFANKPVYDSTTGIFTAPEAGIYQFEVSLVDDGIGAQGDSDIGVFDDVFLTKNGLKKRITTQTSYQVGENRYDTYLQLNCTIYLNKNDSIKIEHFDGGTVLSQSTFSGFKIN